MKGSALKTNAIEKTISLAEMAIASPKGGGVTATRIVPIQRTKW